jgi:hypothetical protein
MNLYFAATKVNLFVSCNWLLNLEVNLASIRTRLEKKLLLESNRAFTARTNTICTWLLLLLHGTFFTWHWCGAFGVLGVELSSNLNPSRSYKPASSCGWILFTQVWRDWGTSKALSISAVTRAGLALPVILKLSGIETMFSIWVVLVLPSGGFPRLSFPFLY